MEEIKVLCTTSKKQHEWHNVFLRSIHKLGTVHIKMYILHDYGVTFCLEIPTHRRLQARAYLGIAQVISNCVFLSRGPDMKTHGMPPDPA